MSSAFAIPVPEELVEGLKQAVREAVAAELSEHLSAQAVGFLDVDGAAAYLSTTACAIRALVKRDAIPYHKAPNGRILFDRAELRSWVRFEAR